MLFWTIIKMSLKSLMANPMRSCLAMLGIVIGVAAVISMLAIGSGAKRKIMSDVESMGTNLLILRPQSRRRMGVATTSTHEMKIEDAIEILKTVDGVEAVSPVINGQATVKHFNTNTQTSIVGVAPVYFPIRNLKIDQGRLFSDMEDNARASVAILGNQTATDLFGTDDAVGEIVKIRASPAESSEL